MQSTMNQQNKDTHASALLEGIYKNARMGADALLSLMPKVADSSLRRDLTAQLDGYQGYANKAEAYLCEQGTQAKDAGIFQKVATKVGIGVNTLMDSDTSHLAEMVIEGSNMNITESVKLSDTAFYKEYDVGQRMPEDTLVVLLRPIGGAYSKDKAFEQAEAYYRAIIGE